MSVHIEKWDYLELPLKGPETGNPFLEVKIEADFTQNGRVFRVAGFYDGGGVYRLYARPRGGVAVCYP